MPGRQPHSYISRHHKITFTFARQEVPPHQLNTRSAEASGRRLVRLLGAGPEVLDADLADVAHLSPDGCAALFMALRAARAHGTRLSITHADDRARSVPLQIGPARALSIRNGDGSWAIPGTALRRSGVQVMVLVVVFGVALLIAVLSSGPSCSS